jgi:hypothetical protein
MTCDPRTKGFRFETRFIVLHAFLIPHIKEEKELRMYGTSGFHHGFSPSTAISPPVLRKSTYIHGRTVQIFSTIKLVVSLYHSNEVGSCSNASDLYSGGVWLKSWRTFHGFPPSPRQMLGWDINLDHYLLLPNPFLFIAHYHQTFNAV